MKAKKVGSNSDQLAVAEFSGQIWKSESLSMKAKKVGSSSDQLAVAEFSA